MKPRIRRRFGIWECGLRYSSLVRRPLIGYGYTPTEAFREWQALSSLKAATV